GISIEDAWAKGPRAYQMTAIPGFPNLFTVLGPNSPTGSISLQYTSELTARYIAQWLAKFRTGELTTVEVTDQATTRFNDDVAIAMGPTVWNTGCNSWYLTEGGNAALQRMQALMRKHEDEFTQVLSAEERQLLIHLLARLHSRAEAEPGAAPPR
ncbi:MAG: hypothetical protein J0H00_18315, partial [Burkholderiales bacterium]|nr:hypothetical protein [Burkholderiales bacterium]